MKKRLALIGGVALVLIGSAYVWSQDPISETIEQALPSPETRTPLGVSAPDKVAPPARGASKPEDILAITPKDYWGAADSLYGVYTRGLQSNSSQLKFLAREALNICLPYAMKKPYLEAASRRDGGQYAAELARVREKFSRSCQAFSGVSPADLLQQQRELSADIKKAEFPINPAEGELGREPGGQRVGIAKDMLRSALETNPTDNLLWLAPALGGWIEHASVSNPTSLADELKDIRHIDSAILITQCKLGYSCGPESVAYMTICTSTGVCPGSLEAYALNGLNESEKEIVQRQAELVAKAIASRNLSALGL
ncbi:hypothetical protein [Roseateles sp.]|uniref:hypothetical protein n=1 Tax=Roseateles sp. TaxID=1971397 RepID=UPI002F3E5D1D